MHGRASPKPDHVRKVVMSDSSQPLTEAGRRFEQSQYMLGIWEITSDESLETSQNFKNLADDFDVSHSENIESDDARLLVATPLMGLNYGVEDANDRPDQPGRYEPGYCERFCVVVLKAVVHIIRDRGFAQKSGGYGPIHNMWSWQAVLSLRMGHSLIFTQNESYVLVLKR